MVITLADGTVIKLPTWSAFEALRTLCNQMNTNISSLQTIVAALQNNDYVTKVEPVIENGKTIGYTIYFSKSNPVTIYHGNDGKDGADGKDGTDGYTPVIGVKQDTDGIYYWTVDGEWLLDANGNKIKAVGTDGKDGQDGVNGEDGKDGADGPQGPTGPQGPQGPQGEQGVTPQLKIENGYWHISYDNGASWTQLGKATGEDGKDGQDGANGADGKDGKDGDSFFQSVTQDEQFVYFTLSDGTVITIPKGASLSIEFAESDLVVMSPNSTRTIRYSVQSVTENVTVEITSSSDLRAKVVADDPTGKSGKIEIKSGSIIDEYSKVIIFVSNGEKVVMKSLAFEQAGITITDGASQSISAEGGNINLNFMANIDWSISIPKEAQSWVKIAPTTLAMTAYSVKLSISPNTTLSERTTQVQIITTDGNIAVDYTISQSAFNAVSATTPNSNGWQVNDYLSVFAGNNKNQQFRYTGVAGSTSGVFEAVKASFGIVTAMDTHYAVYPYSTSYKLSSNGTLSITIPATQTYVSGGYSRALDVMVGAAPDLSTPTITLQPICAYVCVKLWGTEQTIKSVALVAKGGATLAGTAMVTPKYNAQPECTMATNGSTSVAINCTELTLGASEATATEFWFVVPPIALTDGYSVKVTGFYGGEQTIDFPATTFVSGSIYNIGSKLNLSTDGPGIGVGGWGDGENIGGEI